MEKQNRRLSSSNGYFYSNLECENLSQDKIVLRKLCTLCQCVCALLFACRANIWWICCSGETDMKDSIKSDPGIVQSQVCEWVLAIKFQTALDVNCCTHRKLETKFLRKGNICSLYCWSWDELIFRFCIRIHWNQHISVGPKQIVRMKIFKFYPHIRRMIYQANCYGQDSEW